MKSLSLQIIAIFFFTLNTAVCQVFSDITESIGISPVSAMTDTFGSGASIVDFDNDGDLDFFIGTEFGLTNRIYENLGNGQFSEVAQSLGITSTYRNRAALWFDYNGDELYDIVLVGDCRGFDNSCVDRADITLYKQLANGNFEQVNNSGLDFGEKYSLPNVREVMLIGGIAAGDINNDGWLDLLVTAWNNSVDGAEMTMFLNNNGVSFTDITDISFPNHNDVSRFQPIFHDFDNDGLIDIYISIDFTANEFWHNQGNNVFEEIGGDIGCANAFNEMGLTLGDYDNDGDFDMYATNITRLDPTDGSERHNILLKNDWVQNNSLGFSEESDILGIDQSGWDWGTTFFDANNDGWLDLATTNGYDLEGWSPDQSKLWLSVEGLTFSDISSTSGFNDYEMAASLVAFDMERDGDLDLLQTIKVRGNNLIPLRLLQNNYSSTTNANNYLVIKPRMNGNNHYAIGAVVKIDYDNGTTGMRLITAGTSFFGQEPAEAFFGLADNTSVDEVRIEWPDNTVTLVNDVDANQVVTITNDNALSTNEDVLEAISIFPNPAEDFIEVSTNVDVRSVQIHNLLGQKITTKESDTNKLNISFLKPGVYFLKVTVKDNSVSQIIRFVKK
ncbi:MAG: T9SS C-terminal target domain-containing protein [Winogradskyella sp.]|uniref:FG-GAP-like repeat-containing protein n=1 Tax=Winogradskyella sp. TaxID=1883156 RepID=UPI000F3EDE90|nr:FG-GAP-like repeat-containing protein [Winogradskyella sp.]RNC87923.1 MAG: T9SS C-terminal target domain-containing protein [Winogradskyella sp.]